MSIAKWLERWRQRRAFYRIKPAVYNGPPEYVKPCPFCGSEPECNPWYEHVGAYVYCYECEQSPETDDCGTYEEAYAAWNRGEIFSRDIDGGDSPTAVRAG